MPSYQTNDAVCLRVRDFSETSQIVAVFAQDHGLVPLIAKGSKRTTKKGNSGTVSGPLDLLSRGQVVFIPAKGATELGTLVAWELEDPRSALRTSLAAMNAALVLTEVTLLLLHPYDPHPELYAEFSAALALLPGAQRTRAVVAYVKAALTAAGYQPHLDACVNCGAPMVADAPLRYSPRAGGVICGKCPAQGAFVPTQGRIIVALERLESPTVLLAAPPERAADPVALSQALGLLLAHAEEITGKRLKTRALIESVFGAA